MRDKYSDNKLIEAVIKKAIKSKKMFDMSDLKEAILECARRESVIPMPMADINGEYVFPEDENGGLALTTAVLEDDDGNRYLPLFTSRKHLKQAVSPVVIDAPVSILICNALDEKNIRGIVINPFTWNVILKPDEIESIRMSLIY